MKKKKSGGGGANWMDTYGDMVTLLLCFFVLLYSMSTISEDKWRAIVQSFNPSAIKEADAVAGFEGSLSDPLEGLGSLEDPDKAMELDDLIEALLAEQSIEQQQVDAAMQELYETLQQYVDENGLGQSIEITKGDGYVFISFNDAVFFNGDSSVLRPDGQVILDVVADALINAAIYIDEVRIYGHTAQANPDQPNNPRVDRFLSSNRATEALVYLQDRVGDYISPARLVSVGYGQWRPQDTNEDEVHRSHNRRVELLVTGLDLLNRLGDSIQQYYSLGTGEASFRTADGEGTDAAPGTTNSEAQLSASE